MTDKQTSEVLVSFIIPHHGRDAMLLDTVRSISAQRVDGDLELIIISKDTSDAAKIETQLGEIFDRGRVSFIRITSDKTISYGRNFGADRAVGEYLAFIDADVRLAADWVADMIRTLDTNSNCLLSGAIQKADDDNTAVDVIKSSMSQANAGLVNALPGNALFIKKSVFLSHPKFPEHLETCEDWVFTNTLAQTGDVALSDQSHFVHLGEDKDYRTLFRKEVWRGSSNLQSINGRRIDLAEWPSFMVPVAVGGSCLLALCLLLLGKPGLAVALFLFALLAPLLYAVRLKRKSSVPVSFPVLVYFYLVYFLARAVGMVKGIGAVTVQREKPAH